MLLALGAAWVRIGQGQLYPLSAPSAFPRGGAYSGKLNRFNRFSILSEGSDEDASSDEEDGQGLSQEEATLFLDSIEVCSERSIESSQETESEDADDASDFLEEETFGQIPWALGRHCSYYEMDFKGELFVTVEQWIGLAETFSEEPKGCGLGEKEPKDEDEDDEFYDLPFGLELEQDRFCVAEDEEDFTIEGFLSSFPRGGAGGSATNSRKRQINQLVEMLRNWGDDYEASQDSIEEAMPKAIQELKDKLEAWGTSPPSKSEVVNMLQEMVQKLQGDEGSKGNGNKGKGKGADESGSGSQLHRQSFYSALQKRQEENASKGKAKGRSRGAKKGMAEGVGELPKFDIRRAFPGLSFGTWQTAQASLEAAEQPSHTLIQCRDAHQIHLFQDMGKLISIKDKIYLFAGASRGDPEVPGGKKVLLPYLGNIALREAWIGLITGEEVGDSYGTLPKKSDVKAPAKTATTLRINAALDFIQQPLKDQILRSPSLALAAAQIAECVGEAKTFKWSTSAHRMLSGYVSFDSSKVEEVMSHSGRNGIFFQRLAVHVSTQPEVDWISPAETETNAAYLERCLLEAKKINSYLTYRRGGGACIGVVHKQLLDKCRHWSLYGLDSTYGPTCVLELLKSLQWEVPHIIDLRHLKAGTDRGWLWIIPMSLKARMV